MHHVAALGDAAIVLHLAFDRDRARREADIHCAAAGREVLAIPAPADARDDRRGRDPVAHLPAQTSASDFHDYAFVMTARPPMYERNASGTTTEPSACW